jgi:hypothetical protein
VQYQMGSNLTLISPSGNEERLVNRRKVVTEVTIETNQVLVITRRQVTRSRCSECGSDAEFVPLDEVNAVWDEAGNQRGVEAPSGSSCFTKAADGSQVICVRSWQGATTLAKRFISCLSRGSKRKSETRE